MATVNIKKKPEGGISAYVSTPDVGYEEDMTGKAGAKEHWKHLTKKQQWDCLVALRGPDITNSELIKYFTTGVIRQEMGKFMRVGGQLSNYGFVVVASGKVFQSDDDVIRPDLNHFLQHVYEAAEILHIPIVTLSGKQWETMMTKPGTSYAMGYLVSLFKKGSISVNPEVANALGPMVDKYAIYAKGTNENHDG